MDVFGVLNDHTYGSLHLCADRETGLQAAIALHSTTLGPAIGGTRALPYASSADAVTDVIRLARGMSYKASVAGLPHGGGKAVIMLPPGDFDRAALFARFGAFVDSLGGAYITCEDSGTSPADMDRIATRTPHVLGTSGGTGDPSPLTALGVRVAMEAAADLVWGRGGDLAGLHVAVQGIGHVGLALVEDLVRLGARVTLADTHAGRVEDARLRFGVEVVAPDAILATPCDILAPCALGGVVNDTTLPTLQTRVICGAANNVLWEPRHGEALQQAGILYCPDYVVNAGGLINVAFERHPEGYRREAVEQKVRDIRHTTHRILVTARDTGRPPHTVADALAETRIFGAPLA